MSTENLVITREHLPGLLLARTIWETGGPSLHFPPALQAALDQAHAAQPAPAQDVAERDIAPVAKAFDSFIDALRGMQEDKDRAICSLIDALDIYFHSDQYPTPEQEQEQQP